MHSGKKYQDLTKNTFLKSYVVPGLDRMSLLAESFTIGEHATHSKWYLNSKDELIELDSSEYTQVS